MLIYTFFNHSFGYHKIGKYFYANYVTEKKNNTYTNKHTMDHAYKHRHPHIRTYDGHKHKHTRSQAHTWLHTLQQSGINACKHKKTKIYYQFITHSTQTHISKCTHVQIYQTIIYTLRYRNNHGNTHTHKDTQTHTDSQYEHQHKSTLV